MLRSIGKLMKIAKTSLSFELTIAKAMVFLFLTNKEKNLQKILKKVTKTVAKF